MLISGHHLVNHKHSRRKMKVKVTRKMSPHEQTNRRIQLRIVDLLTAASTRPDKHRSKGREIARPLCKGSIEVRRRRGGRHYTRDTDLNQRQGRRGG